jgi:TldD protein
VDEILAEALDAAAASGATYADVRSVDTLSESLSLRGGAVESLERTDGTGFGVRVLVDGAWGYACSARLDRSEARRIATIAVEVARASGLVKGLSAELVDEPVHRASWSSPLQKDPFSVSLEDKIALLTSAASTMGRVPGVRVARGTMDFLRQRSRFLSTEGAEIEQTIVHSGAGIEATAVSESDVQTRSYPGSFRGDIICGGYEFIEAMDLPGNAQHTAEEAVALLSAPECPSATTTLVLDGHQMMLQVHESIGHATELDRILGMEASFAGTSFLDISDVGTFKFGSPVVNVTADATSPGGVGTFAYDDEGVEAQKSYLIKDGILVGLQTSRETAAAVGGERSNGTMRAEGWENFPLIRMTNINLLPDAGSLEDLLADVDDGIYMVTNKSWSIDDKRKNFQFGCEIAWEIKSGRLAGMLKNPRYTGITPVFWASCDAVAGPDEWRMWGTPNCGKGQPGQTMRVGHGTAPARFRNVAVGVSQAVLP